METFFCKCCEQTKPLSDFPPFKTRGKEYRRKLCRKCWKPPSKKLAGRQASRAREAERKGIDYMPGGRGVVSKARAAARALLPKTTSFLQTMLCREAHRAWREWIYIHGSDADVAHYFRDRPWRNPRLTDAQCWVVRYHSCPEFNAKERARTAEIKERYRDHIWEYMRQAIVRGGNSPTAVRAFGFTVGELKQHIERLFVEGMSWDRYALGEIHIDHIIPKAAFNMTDDEQWSECWRLDNLQPLWAKENICKAAKLSWVRAKP